MTSCSEYSRFSLDQSQYLVDQDASSLAEYNPNKQCCFIAMPACMVEVQEFKTYLNTSKHKGFIANQDLDIVPSSQISLRNTRLRTSPKRLRLSLPQLRQRRSQLAMFFIQRVMC